MDSGSIAHLTASIDALAAESVGGPLGLELRELQRLRARLDAEISRRVAAFHNSGDWAPDARNTASWLARDGRIGLGTAHRAVNVAPQIREMPEVAAAWAGGEIGTEHVEALAQARAAAGADERFAELEDVFVEVARAGAPRDVVHVLRQFRDALDAERQDMRSLAEQQYESRALYVSKVNDVTVLDGTADAEAGSYIRRAIDHEYELLHKKGDDRSPAQQRIDALTSICRTYLAGLPKGSNAPHVVLFSDVATYAGEAVALCETDDGTGLAPETMRRIACDAYVSTAVLDATSAVLDMGRAVRNFTPEQRRAILAQYPTCVGPGCTVAGSDCQAHHLVWWDDGGPTDLANGIPLCWHDHHLVHEKRWRVTRDPATGIIDWYRPDGTHAGQTNPRVRPKPIAIRDDLRDRAIARALALAT